MPFSLALCHLVAILALMLNSLGTAKGVCDPSWVGRDRPRESRDQPCQSEKCSDQNANQNPEDDADDAECYDDESDEHKEQNR